ncbi:hypothetical protein [Streptomyces sp. NPDC058632]|uniref:hypothetical protein n=1 Tax=Streptomyces sp. NPDC058632 TaxID=3346567 RepID=UPI00364CC247
MRRGLVHLLAWLLATGAAVTLSWWGVHTVMEGTAYDPPRALPVTAGDATTRESKPVSSSTRRPSGEEASGNAEDDKDAEDAGGSKDKGDGEGAKDADAQAPESSQEPGGTSAAPGTDPEPADPAPAGGDPAPAASGEVKAYDTAGGRAVFDLGGTSASLVSATPGAGWSMQVWKTESWIRVEFTAGTDRVSVFCTWHDGPPRVEIGTY